MAYNSTSYGSSSDQQKLDREAARAFEQNQDTMAEAMKAHDGKLFGVIPIAPEVERAVNTILAPLTSYISDSAASFVHANTEALAKKGWLGKAAELNSGKVATRAGVAALWLTLGFRPITEFIGANKHYAEKKLAFSKDIKAVCEATGVDYRHNEVIKAATNAINSSWMSDMQSMIPGLLVFGTQVPFAIKNQNAFLKEHAPDAARDAAVREQLLKGQTREQAEAAAKALQQKQRLEEYQAARKEFFETNPDGTPAEFKNYLDHINRDNVDASKKDSEHKTLDAMLNQYTFATAAGVLGQDLEKSFRKSSEKKNGKKNSYMLIKELAEQMEARQNPRHVQELVVEIFQQLEVDMGRQRFAGELVNKLREATAPITEALVEGRMDPLSLVKLAGDHKVIEHKNGARSFRSQAEIEASVKELLGTKIDTTNEPSGAEFISRYMNPQLAQETIKAALDKKNPEALKGDERDLFISIMPMDLLEKSGMKKTEIHEARRNAHSKLYDQAAAALVHIVSLDEAFLKNNGVTQNEINTMQQLSAEISAGNMSEVERLVDSHHALLSTIAGITLAEQMEGKNSWAERVVEAKTLKETIANAPEEKAEHHEERHAGKHAKHAHLSHKPGKHESLAAREQAKRYMSREPTGVERG